MMMTMTKMKQKTDQEPSDNIDTQLDCHECVVRTHWMDHEDRIELRAPSSVK